VENKGRRRKILCTYCRGGARMTYAPHAQGQLNHEKRPPRSHSFFFFLSEREGDGSCLICQIQPMYDPPNILSEMTVCVNEMEI
jgi:hypothetical protein